MDDQTALILALQLVALCCIAGALVLYLLCRIKNRNHADSSNHENQDPNMGMGRAILITSCDTAFGLQCALHLSALGFRVFAGLKDVEGSACGKLLKVKIKEREMMQGDGSCEVGSVGALITVPLDVTREDLLHEAVDVIRRNLPAGEDGLWAVLNTAGLCCKGRVEQQDSLHWDALFKYNVIGMLRTARTFTPLLRNKQGRLITVGTNVTGYDDSRPGLVAYTAARFAVEGASAALRHEMAQYGISVITLHPEGVSTDKLFGAPKIGNTVSEKLKEHTVLEFKEASNIYSDYDFSILPSAAMLVLEEMLLSKTPKNKYQLLPQGGFASFNHHIKKLNKKLLFSSGNIKIQTT